MCLPTQRAAVAWEMLSAFPCHGSSLPVASPKNYSLFPGRLDSSGWDLMASSSDGSRCCWEASQTHDKDLWLLGELHWGTKLTKSIVITDTNTDS